MPAQWRLQATLWLPKPPAEVFPFFADAFNLESITPPFIRNMEVVKRRVPASPNGPSADAVKRPLREPVMSTASLA